MKKSAWRTYHIWSIFEKSMFHRPRTYVQSCMLILEAVHTNCNPFHPIPCMYVSMYVCIYVLPQRSGRTRELNEDISYVGSTSHPPQPSRPGFSLKFLLFIIFYCDYNARKIQEKKNRATSFWNDLSPSIARVFTPGGLLQLCVSEREAFL